MDSLPPGYDIERVDLFDGETTWVVYTPTESLDGEDSRQEAVLAAWAHFRSLSA